MLLENNYHGYCYLGNILSQRIFIEIIFFETTSEWNSVFSQIHKYLLIMFYYKFVMSSTLFLEHTIIIT